METWCGVLKKPLEGAVRKQLFDAVEKGKEHQAVITEISSFPDSKEKIKKWIQAAFVVSESRLECNEFFHEVAINLLLSKYCADLPMFAQSQMVAASWHVTDPNCVKCEKRTTMRHCNAEPSSEEDEDGERDKRKKRRKTAND